MKRSVDFANLRAQRIERLAAAYEVDFADMVVRLVDLGMSSLPPLLPPHFAHLDPEVVPASAPAPAAAEGEPAPTRRQVSEEMEWRIGECWAAYAKAFVRFHLHADGTSVPEPRRSTDVRPALLAALRKHDAELLGADQREAWKRESKVRAAGIGLFYDPFSTGADPGNDVRNGSKRYLSWDYAWVQKTGKRDPVERLSALYFERKAAATAAKGGEG